MVILLSIEYSPYLPFLVPLGSSSYIWVHRCITKENKFGQKSPVFVHRGLLRQNSPYTSIRHLSLAQALIRSKELVLPGGSLFRPRIPCVNARWHLIGQEITLDLKRQFIFSSLSRHLAAALTQNVLLKLVSSFLNTPGSRVRLHCPSRPSQP